MSRQLKKAARWLLDIPTGLTAPGRWPSDGPQLLVLTYHRVLPRDYQELSIIEPGMYVHDDTFDRQLAWLGQYFEPVSLSGWLAARAASETLPERAVAITFDDGWQDNYASAFPLLKQHDFPATIFVVTELIGSNASFWPERLARAIQHRANLAEDVPRDTWLSDLIGASGLPDRPNSADISHAIQHAKRYSEAELEQAISHCELVEGSATALPPRQVLNESEVREMAASGLVDFGSHTKAHTRLLESLDAAALQKAVVESKEDIAGLLNKSPTLFCYPNGDRSGAGENLVREHYLGACTTDNGWNSLTTPSHSLRRLTIHQGRTSTRLGFLSRLATVA